jgi:hypothetical protein
MTYRSLPIVIAMIAAAYASPANADPPAAHALDRSPYPPLVAHPPLSIYLGAQAGSVMPLGVTALLLIPSGDQMRWDLDLTWEPSHYLQSYSFGLNYHFFDNAIVAGTRLRYLQMHPPFTRGFRSEIDNQFAVGPELGLHWSVDSGRYLLLFVALGASFFPGSTLELPVLYTLNLGFAIGVARFRR